MEMNLVQKAREFAILAHDGQVRKVNSEPYVNHPIRVAETVQEYLDEAVDPDIYIAAAYLHDVVEDTDVTIEEIRQCFGNVVARYVEDLTELTHYIRPELVAQMTRKEKWLINLTKLKSLNKFAATIKLADRLDNCSIFEEGNIAWGKKYYAETNELLDAIGHHNGFLTDKIRNRLFKFEERVKNESIK